MFKERSIAKALKEEEEQTRTWHNKRPRTAIEELSWNRIVSKKKKKKKNNKKKKKNYYGA